MVEAARGAFIDGLNEILIVAALVAFAGGILGFVLVRGRDFVAARRPAPPTRGEAPPDRGRPWNNAPLMRTRKERFGTSSHLHPGRRHWA